MGRAAQLVGNTEGERDWIPTSSFELSVSEKLLGSRGQPQLPLLKGHHKFMKDSLPRLFSNTISTILIYMPVSACNPNIKGISPVLGERAKKKVNQTHGHAHMTFDTMPAI